MAGRAYISTRKGLFTLENSHNTWSVASAAFLGEHVVNLGEDPRSGRLYASIKHGHFGPKIHRSDDAGKTWREIGTPAYPKRPDDTPPIMCPIRNIEIPWSLDMAWVIEPDNTTEGGLWCGTTPGGLFRSTDHGNHWKLVRPLWDVPNRGKWFGGGYDYPGIHSVLVDPRDADHVTIGVSCGGVWTTFDAGQTWEPRCMGLRNAYMPPEQADDPDVQDPHIVVQCPAQPDRLWMQHHNGIFVTSDGGKQWSEIENAGPSTFGFCAAVHPNDPDTAWFVPGVKDEERIPVGGRFVVTRTRDRGKNFDTLTRGLPQLHAYDIVYRHGLAIDGTGDRLMMGSTTGSVWTTHDRGDTWQTVSSNLPPINAVSFVTT